MTASAWIYILTNKYNTTLYVGVTKYGMAVIMLGFILQLISNFIK